MHDNDKDPLKTQQKGTLDRVLRLEVREEELEITILGAGDRGNTTFSRSQKLEDMDLKATGDGDENNTAFSRP